MAFTNTASRSEGALRDMTNIQQQDSICIAGSYLSIDIGHFVSNWHSAALYSKPRPASQPAIHYAFAISLPNFLQPLFAFAADTSARSPPYSLEFEATPVELLAEGESGRRSTLRHARGHASEEGKRVRGSGGSAFDAARKTKSDRMWCDVIPPHTVAGLASNRRILRRWPHVVGQ